MKMSFSNHVALQVVNLDEAIQFYVEVLQMEVIARSNSEVELRQGPMTFHIEESPKGATFFEFATDDLAAAQEELSRRGCELSAVRTPEGEDSFLVADPFGMKFHVYLDPGSTA